MSATATALEQLVALLRGKEGMGSEPQERVVPPVVMLSPESEISAGTADDEGDLWGEGQGGSTPFLNQVEQYRSRLRRQRRE